MLDHALFPILQHSSTPLIHYPRHSLAAADQLASSRWAVVQGHRRENLLKGLEAGLHKLPGIGRSHGLEPQAKHKPGHRPRGHLVLHDQHDTVIADHALHFMQRFGPLRSLEFVERMGAADRVEEAVDKRKPGGACLNECSRSRLFFCAWLQAACPVKNHIRCRSHRDSGRQRPLIRHPSRSKYRGPAAYRPDRAPQPQREKTACRPHPAGHAAG